MIDGNLLVGLERKIRPARWEFSWIQAALAETPGIRVQAVAAIETAKRERVASEEPILCKGALGLTDPRLSAAASFMPLTPSVVDEFPSRMTLSHGGAYLDHGTGKQVLDYIDWIRSRGDD